MRFSRHQECPQSDPAQERGRRRAKFVYKVKAEIREVANELGLGVTSLADILGCNKSVVSRALDSSSNIELLTMFDFAEAVGKEWQISLGDRQQDLGIILPIATTMTESMKTSWAPIITKGERSRLKSTNKTVVIVVHQAHHREAEEVE